MKHSSKNGNKRGFGFKWKIFLVISLPLVFFAAVAIYLIFAAMNNVIISNETDKIRHSSLELIKMSEDYYMGSINREALEYACNRYALVYKNSFVLFIDAENNAIRTPSAPDQKKIDHLKHSREGIPPKGYFALDLDGRTTLIFPRKTDTIPPYYLYIGIDKKLIDKKVAAAFHPIMVMLLSLLALMVA